MNPDDFVPCVVCCTCPGCDYCVQPDEFEAETEMYHANPDDLACSCGSD